MCNDRIIYLDFCCLQGVPQKDFILRCCFIHLFYFPAFLVQHCNLDCCQTGVIGQEHKFLIGLLILILYPAKFFRIFFLRIIVFQLACLILTNALSFIHRLGVHPFESDVIFCSCHKEGTLVMHSVQATAIKIRQTGRACLATGERPPATGMLRQSTRRVSCVYSGSSAPGAPSCSCQRDHIGASLSSHEVR